jgi:hypothetical protein
MVDYSIYIFHVLFVGPLLLLLGLYHDSPKVPGFIWELLVIMGIGIIGYHSYRAYSLYKIVNSK